MITLQEIVLTLEKRDLEQLQHMLNMEEQDCASLSAHSSDEGCRSPLTYEW